MASSSLKIRLEKKPCNNFRLCNFRDVKRTPPERTKTKMRNFLPSRQYRKNSQPRAVFFFNTFLQTEDTCQHNICNISMQVTKTAPALSSVRSQRMTSFSQRPCTSQTIQRSQPRAIFSSSYFFKYTTPTNTHTLAQHLQCDKHNCDTHVSQHTRTDCPLFSGKDR